MDPLLVEQKKEITSHAIYHRLSQSIRDPHNSEVLRQISDEEMKHYETLKQLTGRDIQPDRWSVTFYYLISKIFG
jgi:rubrerythrin